MANFSLGEAVLGTGVDLAGLTKGMGKAKGEAQSAASDIGDVFKGALSVAGGFVITNVLGAVTNAFGQFFTFVGEGVGQASDLNETVSKVGVIFGDAAGQVLTFASSAATALGQSQQSALDAAATFAIFGKSAGLGGKDLVSFSTELTTLASDLASFNNTSPEQAIQAIGAALRGETEPMRAYGVLLDDASMRQKAFSMGIISSVKDALTPAQKVLAAQALILEQTTLAQGDFARTSQGAANQSRIFAAQVENLQTKLGTALYPAMEAVYSIANTLLIPAFSSFADNVLPGVVAFVGDLSKAFLAFTDSLGRGDIQEAIDSLGEFDSLKGIVNLFGLGNGKLYDFSAAVSDVVAGVQSFFGDLNSGTPLLVALHSALGDLFPADLVYLIWDMQDAFGALLDNDPTTFFKEISNIGADLGGLFDAVDPGDMLATLNDLIAYAFNWVRVQTPIWLANLQSWGQAFVDWVAPQIPPMLATLQDLVAYAFNWVRVQTPVWLANLQAWGQALIDWIGPQIPPVLSALGDLANSLLGWIGEQVPVLVANLYTWGTELINWIAPQVGPMLGQMGTFLGSLTGWIVSDGIPGLATQMATMATELYKWITEEAIPKVGPALTTFKTTLDTFFTETLLPSLVTFGTNFVTSLLDGMGVKMPDDLVKAFSDALGAIGEKFEELKGSIKTIGEGIMGAITDGVMAAAGGLAEAAAKAVNDAIEAAKAAVSGLGGGGGGGGSGSGGGGSTSSGGGGGGGSGVPVFPQADGGNWLVTRPTLFLAGEAGPEVATFTPMDGIRAAVADLQTQPQASTPGNTGKGGLTLNIGPIDLRGSSLSLAEVEARIETAVDHALTRAAAQANIRLQLGY